jgi:aspartyl-tRNA(Asn)/glutamyl-tRNA(Gln) amidotransferase subunit A
MRARFDAMMERFDAVVTPTRTGVAPPIGYDFDRPPVGASPSPSPTPGPAAPRPPATIPAGNLVGAPAVCVPNGFGRDGLPTSLQFLGRAFSEDRLLALAHRYQQATDWHRRRPPLDRLAPAPRASAATWTDEGEAGRADLYRL